MATTSLSVALNAASIAVTVIATGAGLCLLSQRRALFYHKHHLRPVVIATLSDRVRQRLCSHAKAKVMAQAAEASRHAAQRDKAPPRVRVHARLLDAFQRLLLLSFVAALFQAASLVLLALPAPSATQGTLALWRVACGTSTATALAPAAFLLAMAAVVAVSSTDASAARDRSLVATSPWLCGCWYIWTCRPRRPLRRARAISEDGSATVFVGSSGPSTPPHHMKGGSLPSAIGSSDASMAAPEGSVASQRGFAATSSRSVLSLGSASGAGTRMLYSPTSMAPIRTRSTGCLACGDRSAKGDAACQLLLPVVVVVVCALSGTQAPDALPYCLPGRGGSAISVASSSSATSWLPLALAVLVYAALAITALVATAAVVCALAARPRRNKTPPEFGHKQPRSEGATEQRTADGWIQRYAPSVHTEGSDDDYDVGHSQVASFPQSLTASQAQAHAHQSKVAAVLSAVIAACVCWPVVIVLCLAAAVAASSTPSSGLAVVAGVLVHIQGLLVTAAVLLTARWRCHIVSAADYVSVRSSAPPSSHGVVPGLGSSTSTSTSTGSSQGGGSRHQVGGQLEEVGYVGDEHRSAPTSPVANEAAPVVLRDDDVDTDAKADPDDQAEDAMTMPVPVKTTRMPYMVRVKHAYHAEDASELSLAVGQLVTVAEDDGSGWLWGQRAPVAAGRRSPRSSTGSVGGNSDALMDPDAPFEAHGQQVLRLWKEKRGSSKRARLEAAHRSSPHLGGDKARIAGGAAPSALSPGPGLEGARPAMVDNASCGWFPGGFVEAMPLHLCAGRRLSTIHAEAHSPISHADSSESAGAAGGSDVGAQVNLSSTAPASLLSNRALPPIMAATLGSSRGAHMLTPLPEGGSTQSLFDTIDSEAHVKQSGVAGGGAGAGAGAGAGSPVPSGVDDNTQVEVLETPPRSRSPFALPLRTSSARSASTTRSADAATAVGRGAPARSFMSSINAAGSSSIASAAHVARERLHRRVVSGGPPVVATASEGTASPARSVGSAMTMRPRPRHLDGVSHTSSPMTGGGGRGSPLKGEGPPMFVQALSKYDGDEEAGQLSFQRGEVLAVVEKRPGQWWLGFRVKTGETGVFPRASVKACLALRM